MGVIKLVKEITGLGLKEAKEVVDNAPKTIKEAVSKAEAEKSRPNWKKLARKSSSNKLSERRKSRSRWTAAFLQLLNKRGHRENTAASIFLLGNLFYDKTLDFFQKRIAIIGMNFHFNRFGKIQAENAHDGFAIDVISAGNQIIL